MSYSKLEKIINESFEKKKKSVQSQIKNWLKLLMKQLI